MGELLRFNEVFDFRRSLTPETDRGCALMAGAYLDDQLGVLLRARMIDDGKVAGALVDIPK